MTSAARVMLLAALVGAGCARSSGSQDVADRFMELYYARANVAEAAKLCDGAAATKLERELQAIKGVPRDAGADEPRVTVTADGSSTRSATETVYRYRVAARTADVGTIATSLTVTQREGRWLVTSVEEEQAAPPS